MMIGSKGPSDALARSLETLIDPQNTNGVVILLCKMTGAVSVLAAHCTRSVRAANHQLGGKIPFDPSIIICVKHRVMSGKKKRFDWLTKMRKIDRMTVKRFFAETIIVYYWLTYMKKSEKERL